MADCIKAWRLEATRLKQAGATFATTPFTVIFDSMLLVGKVVHWSSYILSNTADYREATMHKASTFTTAQRAMATMRSSHVITSGVQQHKRQA